MRKSDELEKAAVLDVAALMAAAARTAPKTRGIDNIEVVAVEDGATKDKIVDEMRRISKAQVRPSFERDAGSITGCYSMIVIGVRSSPAGLNCGYCGYGSCEELKKTKGECAYNSIDLGIAVSSAAAVAGRLHIDNRLMYSIGKACLELGLFSKEVKQALGIPLSATGKSPFFDRK